MYCPPDLAAGGGQETRRQPEIEKRVIDKVNLFPPLNAVGSNEGKRVVEQKKKDLGRLERTGGDGRSKPLSHHASGEQLKELDQKSGQ